MKRTVYSNSVYILSSIIAFTNKLYFFSFTIFFQGMISAMAHYYNSSALFMIDYIFVFINFLYGYAQCFLADNRLIPIITGNIINIISAYFYFNKTNYEYNHSIWHLLNGSASIIVSLYGENEEKIYNKLKNKIKNIIYFLSKNTFIRPFGAAL